MIRPRPPVGGAVLCSAGVLLGLVGFVVAEATTTSAWALVGAIVLVVSLLLLVAVTWTWRRGSLVIDTDPRGFTATAARSRLTARWDEVLAVTATDQELRVRRTAGQALVMRLPSGASTSAVTAVSDDFADCLQRVRGAAS